ncbi:MAG: dihydropteroate synthase [Bacteroidota bacterium]
MDLPKIQAIAQKLSLNCKGRLVLLDKPVVMGILNATPDSFFENSRAVGEQLIEKASRMMADGAAFIDIGGYSSRPGAPDVTVQEEVDRVIPAIESLHKEFPGLLISVDTFRAKVAELAVNAGASLINDISSGDDDAEMIPAAARLQVPYIMMHKKGTPRTMNQLAGYENVTLEVLEYFNHKIAEARRAGIVDIILDPGFGFAKNLQHNYELLNNMSDLRVAGLPLLVGVSRKKMIQNLTHTDAAGALNGTTVVNTLALLQGANILRVHDVKEAVECINIVSATHGNFQDL